MAMDPEHRRQRGRRQWECRRGSEDETATRPARVSGYSLEYDAARKIAQGLGAHLDKLTSIVEIKAGKARLLAAAERAPFLFGREVGATGLRRGKPRQLDMFAAIGEAEEAAGVGVASAFRPGETALDRVHQSMCCCSPPAAAKRSSGFWSRKVLARTSASGGWRRLSLPSTPHTLTRSAGSRVCSPERKV